MQACPCQEDTTWNRPLPLWGKWARERGIDLSNPFGIGVFLVIMSRDIEVYDVRVTLPGDDPVSISDVASFAVRNKTTLGALKVDAWILPHLNLYVLAGHTWTDTRLNANVTIDRILGNDLVLSVSEDSDVGGTLLGAGATVVARIGHWFVMAEGTTTIRTSRNSTGRFPPGSCRPARVGQGGFPGDRGRPGPGRPIWPPTGRSPQ